MITAERLSAMRREASPHGFAQGVRIAGRHRSRARVWSLGHDVDDISRQFDVAGTLVTGDRIQHPGRSCGRALLGSFNWASAPQSRWKTSACVWKSLTLLVKQRVVEPLAQCPVSH